MRKKIDDFLGQLAVAGLQIALVGFSVGAAIWAVKWILKLLGVI